MFGRSAAVCILLSLLATTPAAATRLDDVKARGFVQCGVGEGVPGFSLLGADNNWSGMEVDYCRALAAAIFNDPQAVHFISTTIESRWEILSSGAIDVLARASTWTMERDTAKGVSFVGTLFYDGQGFLVKKGAGYASVNDLENRSICMEANTTTVLNAEDFFATNKIGYHPLTFPSQAETVKAFLDGQCAAYSSDTSGLAADRSQFATPGDYVILPEIISKEPLAIAVAQGDDQWLKVARWVYFGLLDAGELGVTQKNVDELVGSDNSEVKRLLGLADEDFGTPIGLTKDWAYRIVKLVGNYGEIYDRNVGPSSPLGLPPGLNALWKDGGIQYAPPIR
jgi:general L-amino acid transport system substrate-binding protein